MIRRVWRAAAGYLSSTGLAVGLLVFVGAWSVLATFIAQGEAASPDVTSWASTYPLVEPIVRVLGLHSAFTSYVFLGCVILLGISTAVCAWRRTKVALSRSRALRSARRAGTHPLAESHSFEVACDPGLTGPEVLSIASDALRLHGIRARHRDGLLIAASPSWSVWGSPVFHWSLVALIAVIFAGQMLRSEGSMAVAVGETKSDGPVSYLSVQAGPWRDWSRVHRSVRVDSFEPGYKTGGIDRGAVPTVSVLDGAGNAIVTQRVYPNNMLHSGSLAISAPACGLSATLALLDAGGTETGRLVQAVDFSQTATEGTVPVRAVVRSDAAGNVVMRMSVTVPLDRFGKGFGEWMPKQPSARVLVTAGDGTPLLDRVVRPGEDIVLPGGGRARLVGIGWYSRLSLVDDPTIPFVYTAMIVAMLGLTMTLVFRQQLVTAAFLEGPDGAVLAVRLRLWRNTSTDRSEIEDALVHALGRDGRGGSA